MSSCCSRRGVPAGLARGGTGGIAKLASSGLLIGTLIPGALLVVLGIVYLVQGNASAAPMDSSHLIPQWTGRRAHGRAAAGSVARAVQSTQRIARAQAGGSG